MGHKRHDVGPTGYLLQELPTDLRVRLAAATLYQELAADEVFVLEGDPCPGLCLVESGLVKVYQSACSGREQVLFFARPGETFGDAVAFTGQPFPNSIRAVERTMIGIVPREVLRRLVEEDARFAHAVICHLSHHLHHVLQVVADLSFRPVDARVAKVLLQALQPSDGIGAGVGRRPLTQLEMADLAGTTRVGVARALAAFIRCGLVQRREGRLVIPDVERLAVLIEDRS